ncbi:MAG: hypothetical protein R6V77_04475 [Candidatus Cloacimonadaceae bacterium]
MVAKNLLSRISLLMIMMSALAILSALEVYSTSGEMTSYTLELMREAELDSFDTSRERNGELVKEAWQGINLQKWLLKQGFTQFNGIRFESPDNYMVRISKAEFDSMPGYIALKRGDEWLDAKGVRVIFPAQREMYWIRGLHRIYLEDFSVQSPPERIFVWESIKAKLDSVSVIEPWGSFSGYAINELMSEIFQAQSGSVIMVARDNLTANLDYPQHLKDALLEVTQDGNLNLVSKLIPAGMWLKDIVYLQCGSVAVIRHDFLYQLPSLFTTLGWSELTFTGNIIRVSDTRKEVALETLYLPDAKPQGPEEWLELP